VALEAGAEDIKDEGDSFDVYTTAENFEKVREALEKNNIKMSSAEVVFIPSSTIHLEGKAAEQMLKLMEALEDHDDVKRVNANFDIDEKEIERIANK